MGSGKLLKRAISKYGVDNFEKKILYVYDAETKMNLAEKILVICDKEVSYNICSGGHGGFGYINDNSDIINLRIKTFKEKYKKEWGIKGIKSHLEKYGKLYMRIGGYTTYYKKINNNPNFLKEMSNLSKLPDYIKKKKITFKKINHQQGKKNSQYGTCWITNNEENKKIKKEELDFWIKKGYIKGRIF